MGLIEKPKDAEILINGIWYKIGRHGYVFMWSCGEWYKSSKTVEEIKNIAIRCGLNAP